MSRYDASVGNCGPYVGCPAPAVGPWGYAAQAPIYPAYPYGAIVPAGAVDIVGQGAVTPPPPAQTVSEKASTFLNQETFGIKNKNLALGALGLGAIYYGWHAGWFGKAGRRVARRHR